MGKDLIRNICGEHFVFHIWVEKAPNEIHITNNKTNKKFKIYLSQVDELICLLKHLTPNPADGKPAADL